MEKAKLKSIIEGVLFTMGSAIEMKKLADITEESVDNVREAVLEMQEGFKSEERGLMLIIIEDKVQLCTKSELFEYLIKIAKAPKSYSLSDTAIETLSIIAYKQPVTRLEIEHIRGVDCSHALNRLLEYNLVEEKGRLNAPGRPILFGTTEEFLRSFGMKSLDDLPRLDEDKVEDFREQAEAEIMTDIDETLNVDV
ncbi:MAG: SMC-Scp complex subunit ScpB [Lachnospiraceae bacterium]|nr:SMC-Scp complex subunit ScpB [Lachnospiraceae bacterium]